MPDCFISYASADERFAKYVEQELVRHGLSVFLASESIRPGEDWSDKIKQNLRSSNWVILLASRAAVESVWVQQEIGGAAVVNKKLVPVVWNMAPSELPGWAPEAQAFDLRGSDAEDVRRQVIQLAREIKADKEKGLLIGAALVGGLILLGSRG